MPLPEITLRAPADVPPIVLLLLAVTPMPMVLPRSLLPVWSVPMKLPSIMFPGPPLSEMPSLLPEMMLRAAGVRPPMRLLDEPNWIITPSLLPRTASPAMFVPMKLPSMVLPPFVSKLIPYRALPRLMTRPRTVLLPALIESSEGKPNVFPSDPSSSIINTALSPSASVFALAPGCM